MNLNLIPLKKQYLEFLRKVRSHPEINRYLFTDVHLSKQAQAKWYKNQYLKDKTYLIFIALDNNKPVGYSQITHIDYNHRSCEVGFCIAPELQGQGYGNALIKKTMTYATKKFKMHRVYLEVFATNQRAIRLYEKAGFKKEGSFQDKIFKNNKFHNVVVMSIIT